MDERLKRRMAEDLESNVYVGYPKYGDDFMSIYIKTIVLDKLKLIKLLNLN